VLSTLKAFEDKIKFDVGFVHALTEHQLSIGWDNNKKMMNRGSFDDKTNAARIYEAIGCCSNG